MSLSINSPESFSTFIEHQVHTRHMSYMDAILEFCTNRELEPEAIVPFISPKIKSALHEEGIALHLLPRANTLPI